MSRHHGLRSRSTRSFRLDNDTRLLVDEFNRIELASTGSFDFTQQLLDLLVGRFARLTP